MAYDIDSYAGLGLLWETLSVEQIEQPSVADLTRVTECLAQAISDVAANGRDLSSRLGASNRAASSKVRQLPHGVLMKTICVRLLSSLMPVNEYLLKG